MAIELRGAVLALALMGLGACSVLPNDGPSYQAVHRDASNSDHGYALVNIDYRVTQVLAEHPAQPMAALGPMTSDAPNDLIHEGDDLSINIYEAGAGPTSVGAEGSAAPTGSSSRSTENQLLPRAVVEGGGTVNVPFAGEVQVVGMTPGQASAAIRRALRGKVVNPEVVVSVTASPANSVTVIGEVHTSGRYQVSANNDRLLDAIAEAGGVTQQPGDLLVTVVRGNQSATISMADLLADPSQNIRLAPRDQVRIVAHSRRISTFGALGKVGEVPMVDDTVTLASTLTRAGGLNTNAANPSEVYLFRFERPEVAQALGVPAFAGHPDVKVPIVYRLDLRNPQGYFLATKFDCQPDDLVDVAVANLAQIQKFFSLINTATSSFYQDVLLGYYLPKL